LITGPWAWCKRVLSDYIERSTSYGGFLYRTTDLHRVRCGATLSARLIKYQRGDHRFRRLPRATDLPRGFFSIGQCRGRWLSERQPAAFPVVTHLLRTRLSAGTSWWGSFVGRRSCPAERWEAGASAFPPLVPLSPPRWPGDDARQAGRLAIVGLVEKYGFKARTV
jgi:hypothetical protein